MAGKRGNVVVMVALFSLLVAAGCATNRETVRTETTRYPAPEPAVVERETTVTTTESGDGSGGVLSTTVNVIGEVVALPFRVVGGLLRAIF